MQNDKNGERVAGWASSRVNNICPHLLLTEYPRGLRGGVWSGPCWVGGSVGQRGRSLALGRGMTLVSVPESPCVTVLGSSRPSQLGVGDGREISGSPLGEG